VRRVALAALVAIPLVVTAASPAPAQSRCTVAKSQTLFENARARVFTRTYGADRNIRTQLCRKSDGRHFGLADDVPDSSTQRVSLIGMRGGWLSYAVTKSTSSTTAGDACRFDVPKGKRRCEGGLLVHGIGVTAAGTLAWLADSGIGSDADPFCCTVYRLDAGARHAVTLDSGADIEAHSFATAPHRAYWVRAGEPQTASLK
jgi:hypothetical protein